MQYQEQNSAPSPLAHSVKSVCSQLGISKPTIFEMFKRGQLRFVKAGSRTLIPDAELRRFLSGAAE